MTEQKGLELCIQRPFEQEVIAIEWVTIISPNGSFTVGLGHQDLVSLVKSGESVTYKIAGGGEEKLTVAEGTSGVVHVTKNKIDLFLVV